MTPRITDDDKNTINATIGLDGKIVRTWLYHTESERRVKMNYAREYVEGWYDATRRDPEPLVRNDWK